MRDFIVNPDTWDITDDYAITNGDCIPCMRDGIKPESVDLSVFSPPFSSLYAYTDSDADMGNSRESDDEFLLHFDFFGRAIYPIIKPGRNVIVHLQQVSRFKVHHGYMGLFDIRGATTRIMERVGFHFYGEVTVDKCPQAQAIRTKSACLTFTQKERDAAVSRPALADYLLIFKKPGKNSAPIKNDVSREEWIEWARPLWREDPTVTPAQLEGLEEMIDAARAAGMTAPFWRGIKETDTLNTRSAKSPNDERHVCPLQLPLIERCVRMWSNPGEVVLSPFMGVGSEGVSSIKLNRRFIGTELNPRYYGVARKNIRKELAARDAQTNLFGSVFGCAS